MHRCVAFGEEMFGQVGDAGLSGSLRRSRRSPGRQSSDEEVVFPAQSPPATTAISPGWRPTLTVSRATVSPSVISPGRVPGEIPTLLRDLVQELLPCGQMTRYISPLADSISGSMPVFVSADRHLVRAPSAHGCTTVPPRLTPNDSGSAAPGIARRNPRCSPQICPGGGSRDEESRTCIPRLDVERMSTGGWDRRELRR